jgi:hypothetical protein
MAGRGIDLDHAPQTAAAARAVGSLDVRKIARAALGAAAAAHREPIGLGVGGRLAAQLVRCIVAAGVAVQRAAARIRQYLTRGRVLHGEFSGGGGASCV